MRNIKMLTNHVEGGPHDPTTLYKEGAKYTDIDGKLAARIVGLGRAVYTDEPPPRVKRKKSKTK